MPKEVFALDLSRTAKSRFNLPLLALDKRLLNLSTLVLAIISG